MPARYMSGFFKTQGGSLMDRITQADRDSMTTLRDASHNLLLAMWREHPAIMRQRTGKALPNVRPD